MQHAEAAAAFIGVAQEEDAPSREEAAHRDPSGMYSAEQPLWAPVTGARYLTTELSEDRKVRSAAAIPVPELHGAGVSGSAACAAWNQPV